METELGQKWNDPSSKLEVVLHFTNASYFVLHFLHSLPMSYFFSICQKQFLIIFLLLAPSALALTLSILYFLPLWMLVNDKKNSKELGLIMVMSCERQRCYVLIAVSSNLNAQIINRMCPPKIRVLVFESESLRYRGNNALVSLSPRRITCFPNFNNFRNYSNPAHLPFFCFNNQYLMLLAHNII